MALIFSENFSEELERELSKASNSVQIISAFCKEDILMRLSKMISASVYEKNLLVRFRLSDIASGATDILVFEVARALGWKMYINFSIHAKTYIFDNAKCIVSSANTTKKGVGICENSNIELSTLIELEDEDNKKLNLLFENSTLMTEEIFSLMKKQLKNCNPKERENLEWSSEIMAKIKSSALPLFAHEFPNSQNISLEMAREFLDCKKLCKTNLIKIFKTSNPYIWLKNILKEHNDEIYFGELSALLHNSLVQDPRPYRREVKNLLANLLAWCASLASDEIIIDRPKHSQRIRAKI